MALPLSYKPGDWLKPLDIFSDSMQKVTGVFFDYYYPDTVAVMTEEEYHVFRVDEQVVFPRRPEGKNIVWRENDPIDLSKVAIGDIIPPQTGFRDEHFAGALRISNITRTKKFGGWYVDLAPVQQHSADKPARYLVPWASYEDFWQSAVLLKPSPSRPQPQDPGNSNSTSGWYEDAFGNHVRFRLTTLRGRRPIGTADTPESQAQWDQYSLLPGEKPHPQDPRF